MTIIPISAIHAMLLLNHLHSSTTRPNVHCGKRFVNCMLQLLTIRTTSRGRPRSTPCGHARPSIRTTWVSTVKLRTRPYGNCLQPIKTTPRKHRRPSMTVTSDTLLSTTRHCRNQVTCRNDNDSLTIVYTAEPTVLLLTLEDKMRRLTHELLVKRQNCWWL